MNFEIWIFEKYFTQICSSIERLEGLISSSEDSPLSLQIMTAAAKIEVLWRRIITVSSRKKLEFHPKIVTARRETSYNN